MTLKISNPSDKPITTGHGEYIVYHQRPNGEKAAPSRPLFNAVYAILSQLNSPSIDNRYALLRSKIKAIDPSLEITFIARSYYEMQFLKKGIKENLKRGDFCPNERMRPNPHAPNNLKDCWHIVHFSGEEDNQAEGVKVLAFNLNENLVKKLNKHLKGKSDFTFQQIRNLTEKQIGFFQRFGDTFKPQYGQFASSPYGDGSAIEKFSGSCHYHLRIKSQEDAQIIQNAVAIECHSIAEKAFLLYRGTDSLNDLPYSSQNPNQPYSFSFGSGLFAGTLYSGGATAFYYIKGSKEGLVMAVPAQEMPYAPFVIPNKHTLCHLSTENGTVFHPRTKIWQTAESIWGGLNQTEARPFFSHLDRETVSDQVLDFFNRNVILLKSASKESMAMPPAFQPTIHIYAQIPPGKSLYIRGNEGGLSWQKGQPLVQAGPDHWIYRMSKNFNRIEYKLLIDDAVWEEGNNHIFEPGKDAIEAPLFPVHSTPLPQKTTRLSIRFNAGMGNQIMIYGNGPGLDWKRGTPLKNVGDDLWIWETTDSFTTFDYKIVKNGSTWEHGPNHRVRYGDMKEIVPRI